MSPLQARIIAIRQKLIELDSWIYDEFDDDDQVKEFKEINND